MRKITENHFTLFGLEPAFALDREALERAYREIQARVHPDRFAHAGDAERRASMQWATRVNEAYRLLRDPLQRAKYLVELNGVDVGFETNTAMPAEFLERQLELREALEAATGRKDAAALDALRAGLARERTALEAEVGVRLDAERDYPAAGALVRKLMFLARLDAEIETAYDAVEA